MGIQSSRIQRMSERHLPDLATIMHLPVIPDDGMGGEGIALDWSIFDDSVPCRISSTFSVERYIGTQIDPIKDVLIVFKKDYTITEEKRIIVNGVTYEIIYIVPKPSYSAMTQVVCRKI